MSIETTGPGGTKGAPELGQTRRVYACTTVQGRKRKRRLQDVVGKLLRRNTVQCPMLNTSFAENTGYKRQGSIAAVPRFDPASTGPWPRKLEFPVYAFRLNVFPGDLNTDGTTRYGEPVIAFQLIGTQQAALGDYTYRWKPLVRASAPTAPVVWGQQEFEVDMRSTSYRHLYTVCDMLLTAPTAAAVDYEISVVRFNDDAFAPPDLYKDSTGIQVFRANSGYDTIQPEQAAEEQLSSYYNTWLHNRLSHPLSVAKRPRSVVGPQPFTALTTKRLTLCARSTFNQDAGPVQHRHRHVLKGYEWVSTASAFPGDPLVFPENVPEVYPTVTEFNCGIFPAVERQRWLMVSAWTHGLIFNKGTALGLNLEPSFDVNLNAAFEFANEHDPTFARVNREVRQAHRALPPDPDAPPDMFIPMP